MANVQFGAVPHEVWEKLQALYQVAKDFVDDVDLSTPSIGVKQEPGEAGVIDLICDRYCALADSVAAYEVAIAPHVLLPPKNQSEEL